MNRQPILGVPVLERRFAGIWITNGRAAWWVPDRRLAAWLAAGVILCPPGWRVQEALPADWRVPSHMSMPAKEGP